MHQARCIKAEQFTPTWSLLNCHKKIKLILQQQKDTKIQLNFKKAKPGMLRETTEVQGRCCLSREVSPENVRQVTFGKLMISRLPKRVMGVGKERPDKNTSYGQV